jgi:hypothetical protein
MMPSAQGLAELTLPPQRSVVARALDNGSRMLAVKVIEVVEETEDAAGLPFVDPMTEYQRNPVGFFVNVLGIPEHTIRWTMNAGYDHHAWDGTPDPLIAMLEGLRDWDDVCVEAGTGTQKSHTAAAAILWFLGCWSGARSFTFAPTEKQLRAFIWMEIGKLWPRFQIAFPSAVLTDLRIRMRGVRDGAWGAQGFAVGQRAGEDVSVNAQGMHAEHMMLVYEETPGIPLPVIEAGENTSTAPHNIRLALGNPDHQLDALHLFGHDQFGAVRPGVRAIRISALDHPNIVTENPNVVPGAASQKSVWRRKAKYGEDGRLYKSRIRGLSPAEAQDALIKLEWVRRAQARWADENDKRVLTGNGKAKKALGVDVANSEDGDEAALSRWTGAYCTEVVAKPCPNANNLGFEVHIEMREQGIDEDHVGVDKVGVGVGAVNELRKRERWIQALGGGDSPIPRDGEDEEYNNLRSQMYWVLREDLRLDTIALPPDAELAQDLITPKWKTSNGKIVIESKEDLQKRLPGGRSPNKGDACVYGNYVRDRSPIVSAVPKKVLTRAQRLQKELEDLDKESYDHYEPSGSEKYGGILRQ